MSYSPPLSVIAGVVGLQVVYLLCIGRYRDRFRGARPVALARRLSFSAGLLIILIALASPLDTIADQYLFWVHMLQHLLLTLGAAPLLLAGTPGWLLTELVQATRLTGFVRWARHPLIAFFGFNIIFSLAHLPSIYELALSNELLHALEHLVFLGSALLMWMPVLSPAPELVAPYPPIGQVLYLFFQTLPAGLVGALLSMPATASYATYVAAPRLFGMSAVEDQQAGGLLMWVGGGFYFLIASAVVFFVWAAREEAANRRPVGVVH